MNHKTHLKLDIVLSVFLIYLYSRFIQFLKCENLRKIPELIVQKLYVCYSNVYTTNGEVWLWERPSQKTKLDSLNSIN